MAKKAAKKAAKNAGKKDQSDGSTGPRETSEHQDLPGVAGVPGAARVAIDGIDRAYRNYRPIMEQRQSLLEKEKGLKNVVISKMHEHVEDLPRDEANNSYYITTDDKRLVLQTKGEKLVIVDEETGD